MDDRIKPESMIGMGQNMQGWAEEQVIIIDDDLGRSGANAEGRPGFQRLVTEVSLDRVGLILGIDMSRLARSCRD